MEEATDGPGPPPELLRDAGCSLFRVGGVGEMADRPTLNSWLLQPVTPVVRDETVMNRSSVPTLARPKGWPWPWPWSRRNSSPGLRLEPSFGPKHPSVRLGSPFARLSAGVRFAGFRGVRRQPEAQFEGEQAVCEAPWVLQSKWHKSPDVF